MEKKFKFSDNPKAAKILYAAVIALLCVTAIVVGIVAANNRKDDVPDTSNPPIGDGNENGGDQNGTKPDETPDDKNEDEGAAFISPAAGRVMKNHSPSTPVFSDTLEEWRTHTGIDILTEEGAGVYAAADGEVHEVRSDPLLGKTVVIMHKNGMKTVYSNLSAEGLPSVGDKVVCGQKIGTVGDTAITEIADESHLHFEMLVNGVSVNPLDYISEESKKTSLGIDDGTNV